MLLQVRARLAATWEHADGCWHASYRALGKSRGFVARLWLAPYVLSGLEALSCSAPRPCLTTYV